MVTLLALQQWDGPSFMRYHGVSQAIPDSAAICGFESGWQRPVEIERSGRPSTSSLTRPWPEWVVRERDANGGLIRELEQPIAVPHNSLIDRAKAAELAYRDKGSQGVECSGFSR